ncbi:FtsB family cell division protein [Pseudonocardia phyllosphaerae]|uniref:FtsB family cell division protein n=1 Tax=Pseudonocardia phyllosphaerae TaxID=3390502 RepID=UPI00397A8FCF
MADTRGRGGSTRARPSSSRARSRSGKPRTSPTRGSTTSAGEPRKRPSRSVQGRPRLTRARSRAGEVVAKTTGLIGLSSTKRAAILAIVVCALALTVAVPLHNYVAQRQELASVSEQQQALEADVARLSADRARLSDPAEVAAQARSRLHYVAPGEIPYVVQYPQPPKPAVTDGQAEPGVPWFRTLWGDVTGDPRR